MSVWEPGQTLTIDGLTFHVTQGHKHPDDLRLEVEGTDGVRRAVHMRLGAMLADFFYANETRLYPPPALGGRKYLQYVSHAARFGWDRADLGLRMERAQRRLF